MLYIQVLVCMKDQVLQRYKYYSRKKKSNPSSPTTIIETKFIGKNIPRKKTPNLDSFNDKFYQTFKK